MASISRQGSESIEPDSLSLDLRPDRYLPHRWYYLGTVKEFVASRRSKHTAVVYGPGESVGLAVYIFGGDSGNHIQNDVIRYDPSENSWSRMFSFGQPPSPRFLEKISNKISNNHFFY